MMLRLWFETRIALRASNRSLGPQVLRTQIYKGTIPRLLLGPTVHSRGLHPFVACAAHHTCMRLVRHDKQYIRSAIFWGVIHAIYSTSAEYACKRRCTRSYELASIHATSDLNPRYPFMVHLHFRRFHCKHRSRSVLPVVKRYQDENLGRYFPGDATTDSIEKNRASAKPFLTAVWFGSPHGPHEGAEEDLALHDDVSDGDLKHRFAEITAMHQAIGDLQKHLH